VAWAEAKVLVGDDVAGVIERIWRLERRDGVDVDVA
jgi:hypothetical protein